MSRCARTNLVKEITYQDPRGKGSKHVSWLMQKAAHSMGLQAERTLQVGRENSDKNGNSDRNMYCVIHTSQSANVP
jgi:hypothetical protein